MSVSRLLPPLALCAGLAAQQQPAPHWSFVPPVRVEAPAVDDPDWASNPVDRFVWRRLDREGLRPSQPADRATLIRRASLALTGLPPTPEEVDAFERDPDPQAYDRLVDRLLASSHYGERMAQWWLDLARYADTDGYHIDGHRDMWKWREWVIDAFNANKPFDQFTVEQLAGDLLPGRTIDQRVATGFNRNNMTNIEGGADPEEYATRYVVDRANTTATVWLGLTMKCAECHDHKYDPITHKDYYRFYAFFSNNDERGLGGYFGNAPPLLPLPSKDQLATLTRIQSSIKQKEKVIERMAPELLAGQARWERDLREQSIDGNVTEGLMLHYELEGLVDDATPEASGTVQPAVVSGSGTAGWGDGAVGQALALDGIGTHLDCGPVVDFERTDSFSVGAWIYLANGGVVVAKLDDEAAERGFDLTVLGQRAWFTLSHNWRNLDGLRVQTENRIPRGEWCHVLATYDGTSKASGVTIYVDGVPQKVEVQNDALTGSIRTAEPLRIGRRSLEYGFQGAIDEVRIYDRVLAQDEVARLAMQPALQAIAVAPEQRTDRQLEELRAYYRDHVSPEVRGIMAEIAQLMAERDTLAEDVPSSMIMKELREPRATHLLLRGDYRRRGERVYAGVPAFLGTLAAEENPNRLALAKWLVGPDQPLTARVTVNRIWQHLFGKGLVTTSHDFGTQGDRPSHPELLDWLATELVRTGWDIKRMVDLIASSRTFRQSSVARPDAHAVDPENRLLARSPRLRLDAETIRDNALAISGLLDRRVGGPSVFPYQPPGLWEEIAFGGGFSSQTYEKSDGEDQYRRGMYVYWKRSSPYASFRIFDAPTRELCATYRGATNTPLQALTLMDDPVYLEAARALAARILTEGGTSDQERLTFAIRLCFARAPRPGEVEILSELAATESARFVSDPEAATALLEIGDYRHPGELDSHQLAAWTLVSSTLLNTSEVITRP